MLTALATLICVMLCVLNGVDAADFLFVQTATGAMLNGTLTLMGVANDVTYFSDRPVRVAGIMSSEDFLTLFEPQGTFSEVYVCVSSMHAAIRVLRKERERECELTRLMCARMCVYMSFPFCVRSASRFFIMSRRS